jgi:hypothetical protein
MPIASERGCVTVFSMGPSGAMVVRVSDQHAFDAIRGLTTLVWLP